MKLILIYGSPAVGKLTVANEIAGQTDFRVFHNHLTIDAVEPVFEFGTPPFWKLVHLFRVETIAEVTKVVEENGGEICFVLLVCEKTVIEKRVLEDSRKQFGKANNLKVLHDVWDKYDLFLPVPERESLIIDNTNLSAAETARKIIGHFQIGQIDLTEPA